MRPVDLELPAEASSAGAARAAVRALVVGSGPADLSVPSQQALDRVLLLTSEIVTNAVLHARTPLRLTAAVEGGRAEVRVYDGLRALPRRRAYRSDSGTGRGLHLIDALADQWGVEETNVGKVVWFSIAVFAADQVVKTG